MREPVIVPAGEPDPIQYLLSNGWSVITLAVEWGYNTPDPVYRFKRFGDIPNVERAQRMAQTFGPDWTAGDVINCWLAGRARVEAEAQYPTGVTA